MDFKEKTPEEIKNMVEAVYNQLPDEDKPKFLNYITELTEVMKNENPREVLSKMAELRKKYLGE